VVLYRITVPAGKTKLTVSTTGPGGQDVDIFVRKSLAPVVPVTTAAFTADCKSDGPDDKESCSVDNPKPGTWYIALQLWSAYSNVSLTATYIP
jgi:vibriolysin